jgi:uncharacterized integral membrane protein (TIGR00698 family)
MSEMSQAVNGAELQKSFAQEVIDSLPGLILVVSVAVLAHFAAPLLLRYEFFKTYLSLKDFILAILVGIAIRNTVGVPSMLQPGLRFSTILTKTGIVVMGAKYSLIGLVTVGGQALGLIAFFLFSSAVVLMWIGSRLKISPSLSACLAAGLSVCGVSATIAVAPAVNAKKEEMAYSIAVVLMFGLLALVVFPSLGQWLGLTDAQYGAFAGVGIINSAQVLAAGFGFSEGAGVVAGVYNIGRVLFLPFVVLMLTIMAVQRESSLVDGPINKRQIIISKFPVFVLGFLVVVMLNTMGWITKPAGKTATLFMEWCFLLGFASIGLTTRLSDLKAAGISGVFVGFTVATIKAGLALLAVLYFID